MGRQLLAAGLAQIPTYHDRALAKYREAQMAALEEYRNAQMGLREKQFGEMSGYRDEMMDLRERQYEAMLERMAQQQDYQNQSLGLRREGLGLSRERFNYAKERQTQKDEALLKELEALKQMQKELGGESDAPQKGGIFGKKAATKQKTGGGLLDSLLGNRAEASEGMTGMAMPLDEQEYIKQIYRDSLNPQQGFPNLDSEEAIEQESFKEAMVILDNNIPDPKSFYDKAVEVLGKTRFDEQTKAKGLQAIYSMAQSKAQEQQANNALPPQEVQRALTGANRRLF